MRALHIAAGLALAAALVGCSGDDGDSGASDKSTTSTETKSEQSEQPPAEVAPQPLFASKLLVGDAKPNLPDGEADKISVIAQAPLAKSMDSATLTFAFRNNTDEALGRMDWTATARADGQLVATGSNQGWSPAVVEPGEIGFAYIYFEAGGNIPDTGATYEFTPTASPADTEIFSSAPLAIEEFSRNGNTIVGAAVNDTGKDVTGPISIGIYCFDGDDLTGYASGFAEEDAVVAGGTATFTVTLYDKCNSFAMDASGWFE